MAYASVNSLEELKEASEDYLKYWEKKQELKSKYPKNTFPNSAKGFKANNKPATEEEREDYKKYLKEIGDLLFQPEGDYQNFVWNHLTSENEREQMERRARGRLPRQLEY